MLKGTLVYKDTPVGEFRYTVLARDSFNDLKMVLTIEDDGSSYEKAELQRDFFDLMEDGTVNAEYKNIS